MRQITDWIDYGIDQPHLEQAFAEHLKSLDEIDDALSQRGPMPPAHMRALRSARYHLEWYANFQRAARLQEDQ